MQAGRPQRARTCAGAGALSGGLCRRLSSARGSAVQLLGGAGSRPRGLLRGVSSSLVRAAHHAGTQAGSAAHVSGGALQAAAA